MKILILLLFSALAPLSADENPVLRFLPENTHIGLNDEAEIKVQIDSVEALVGYSVEFSYNSDTLGVIRVREGTMLPPPTFFAAFIDSLEGTVKVESVLLGSGRKVDGSGVLFTVDVYGKVEGRDTLIFFNDNFRDVDLERIEIDTEYGIVTVGDPTGVNVRGKTPHTYRLFQNYPNPFNPVTTVRFYLPESSSVSFGLFDIQGREIRRLLNSEWLQPGIHSIHIHAAGLSSGIYYYRLEAYMVDGRRAYDRSLRMVVIR